MNQKNRTSDQKPYKRHTQSSKTEDKLNIEISYEKIGQKSIKPQTREYSLCFYVLAIISLVIIALFWGRVIDTYFTGVWRDKFPFNLIEHPHPDFHLSAEQIIKNEGFLFEEHEVETDDGYLNVLFRVNRPDHNTNKPVVILIHGLIDSSDSFFVNGREKSLGFTIPEAGFDVWLVNTRGNKYSNKHKWLNPEKDLEYWEHGSSLDIAKNDFPAFLSYVQNYTKTKKVSIIGHSQGSQQVLYNLAKKPEFMKENINLLIALCPFLQIKDTGLLNKPMIWFFTYIEPLNGLLKIFRSYPLWFSEKAFKYNCGYMPSFCNFLSLYIAQNTTEFNDQDRQKIFYSHYPAQSSYKAWVYVNQMINSDRWLEVDYGIEKNLKIYGQKTPPEIDYKPIVTAGVPLVTISGKHDLITVPEDNRVTISKLGDAVVEDVLVDGGHIVFMIGKNASYINTTIIPNLIKYSQ